MPSSVTRTRVRPPCSISTCTRGASASSAFSTSSLTTLAGRSTTSPAAIWFARSPGRRRIRPIAWLPLLDRLTGGLEELARPPSGQSHDDERAAEGSEREDDWIRCPQHRGRGARHLVRAWTLGHALVDLRRLLRFEEAQVGFEHVSHEPVGGRVDA